MVSMAQNYFVLFIRIVIYSCKSVLNCCIELRCEYISGLAKSSFWLSVRWHGNSGANSLAVPMQSFCCWAFGLPPLWAAVTETAVNILLSVFCGHEYLLTVCLVTIDTNSSLKWLY